MSEVYHQRDLVHASCRVVARILIKTRNMETECAFITGGQR